MGTTTVSGPTWTLTIDVQLPAFYPQTTPGMEIWTVRGIQSSGPEIVADLLPAEVAAVKADPESVQQIIDGIPLERATTVTFASL